MDLEHLDKLIVRFLDAWNAGDVGRVLDVYTDDVRYRDPNTHGTIEGREALGRYLTKLFARWRMCWFRREVFLLSPPSVGVAFLWRATFQRPDSDAVVEADGMDLAILRGDKLARNEVYFDRAALVQLAFDPTPRAS